AGLFGAIGNTIGSWVAYYAGMYGGRPMAEKYGKYILVSRHDLDLADRFFDRWGNWAIFFSRLLPVVRTFISVPAGISRMPIWQFTVYTFAGAFIWSTGLAYGGYKLGENYERLRNWMRPLDYPIAAIIVVLVVWYVYRHVKRAWAEPEAA
ncbi:MAG TPA: DedA family protein, partial [Dehalococcoidia bacterium]